MHPIHYIPAAALGPVQRGIRIPQKFPWIAFSGIDGDSYAEGNEDLFIQNAIGIFCYMNPEPFSNSVCPAPVDTRQNNQEFLTSIPADSIVMPDAGLHSVGYFNQYGISRHMAESIVYSLEVVDIRQRYAERIVHPLGTVGFSAQDVQNRRSIP